MSEISQPPKKNKKQRQNEKHEATWQWMKSNWPAVFGKDKALPLDIGVHQTIHQRLIKDQPDLVTHTAIRNVLRGFTRRIKYLKAMKAEGAYRHNLTGQPTIPVSEQHQQEALHKLEKQEARRKAVKKTEIEQQKAISGEPDE